MPWYGWVILACVVIGPFDALYVYIKNQKRREALRKKRESSPDAPKSSEDRPKGA
ncbi:MAG: hypothetical protein IJH86_04255 [Clostridia bacterium]|nr:hypothetical protein [Clostridia bacterium]